MPRSSKKPCSRPGCQTLTESKDRFCSVHKKYNSNYNHRLSSSQRGYGWQWQKLRKIIFRRDNKLCQICLTTGRATEAVVVDHIIPKVNGGTDDADNLQSLCARCHDHKTATEDSKKGHGGVENQGFSPL